jgi:hypothetical protein
MEDVFSEFRNDEYVKGTKDIFFNQPAFILKDSAFKN